MPTIIRQDGFRVGIYSDDHLPPHVHVFKGGAEIRINLGAIATESIAPSIMDVIGKISNKDLAKALSLVSDHQLELLEKWSDIHG